MAKQNRYYLLMAMLVSGTTIGYEAWGKNPTFSISAHCLRINSYSPEGDDYEVEGVDAYHKCIPYTGPDDGEGGDMGDLTGDEWDSANTCANSGDTDTAVEVGTHYIGEVVRLGTSSYGGLGWTCGSGGWVECPDVSVFNGTLYSCCGYSKTSTQATCSGGYYRGQCDSGYYGAYIDTTGTSYWNFSGKSTDCYQCTQTTAFNGTFDCCGTKSTTSTKVTCSRGYMNSKCNAGYYGTYTGGSTDCTKCVTGPDAEDSDGTAVTIEGQSVAGTNTVITQCFVPKGDSAGSFTYVDGTGNYVFSTNCYYSK